MKRRLIASLLTTGMIFVLTLFVNADIVLDFDVDNNIEMSLQNETETYFSGLGTKEQPYVISTSQNLVDLSTLVNEGNDTYSSAYYSLANDIDMSGIDFVPIGGKMAIQTINETTQKYVINHFGGNFNGNGYAIRNVNISAPLYKYIGFFGYGKNASVDNLRLENISVTGENQQALYAGTLFGVYDGDDSDADLHIKNCYVNGELSVESEKKLCAGGIIGYNRVKYNTSIIEDCYIDININASSSVMIMSGGLIAEIESGVDISKCVVVGTINTNTYKSLHIGGVVGYAANNDWMVSDYDEWHGLSESIVVIAEEEASLQGSTTYVSICDVVSSVDFAETGKVGNIVAYVDSDNPVTVESCYYDSQYEVTGTIGSENGTAKTNSELFDKEFLSQTVGLDFARTWKKISGELDLASYTIDYSLNGDNINVTVDGATNATVFAAPYSGGRIGTVKVAPYTGVTVPISFAGVEYDYVVLIVLDSNLSPLCEAVIVD